MIQPIYIYMFLRNLRYLNFIGGGGNNWLDIFSYTHICANHSSIGKLNKLQEPRIYLIPDYDTTIPLPSLDPSYIVISFTQNF